MTILCPIPKVPSSALKEKAGSVPGVLACIFNHTTSETKAGEPEFKASLVHVMSSRPSRVNLVRSCFKKQNKTKKL